MKKKIIVGAITLMALAGMFTIFNGGIFLAGEKGIVSDSNEHLATSERGIVSDSIEFHLTSSERGIVSDSVGNES
jgi:hypothetical protein